MHLSNRRLEWPPAFKNDSLLPLGYSRAAILVIFASCFLFQVISGAQVKETRRVLILNDLGITASPGFAEINQALWAGLQKAPYHIELYQESLELTLFPGEVHQRRFREEFIRKYSDRKPDVIIAAGPDSLKFIAESNESFLRDLPVIFCTILGQIPDRLRPDMHFTGVLARLQPEETLRVALRLLPSTKHVVVTGGMGKFDYRWEAIAKQSFHNYESKLDFVYLTDLTMPALLERLKNLPNNTIVYHTAITQDAAGERFIDSLDAVPLVARAANAPVFVMDDVDLNGGTVGGDLVNWADDARVAAGMAVRVLNGERPEDIPVVTSNNTYMFDWRALKRWGLKEKDLPPGSIVLNRQLTFWEAYKRYVLAGIGVLLGQSIAIFALLWQRARRRQIEVDLRKSEEKFSKAFHRSPLSFTLASLTDYRLLEVNNTFERYTGWAHNEVIGLTSLQINFWVDANQRSNFVEQLRTNGAVRNQEILFRKKDGEVRTGLASCEVINVNGEPCALTLMADITDAKRAENEAAIAYERLRIAVEAGQFVGWEWDIKPGTNRWFGDLQGMFGIPSESYFAQGGELLSRIHSADRDRVSKAIDDTMKDKQPYVAEFRILRDDGSVRWVIARGKFYYDSNGDAERMLGMAVDITERKQAEEALASIGRRLIEAQEEERRWIARELHDDINQRLALLAVSLTTLKEHLSAFDVQTSRDLGAAFASVVDLGRDVQALSHRLHSSKLEYLGLVTASKSFCSEFSEQNKVEVRFHSEQVPKDLPNETALCLFRVLQEALQNAKKYSGADAFQVSLQRDADYIELTVSDSGIGFDPQSVAKERGLGLTSMKERIKLVRGQLSIESQPQQGTIIRARVPLRSPLKSTEAVA